MLFTNATWYRNQSTPNYGGYYTDQLMSVTGMSVADVASLFDLSNPDSFGNFVNNYTGLVAQHYGCANVANCTSEELASLQWGSSGVTNNPLVANTDYTPKQLSCANWGAYVMPGCEVAPEYYYWAQDGQFTPLTTQTVLRIQSNSILEYGLLNLYNSMKLANAYFTNNATLLAVFDKYLMIGNTGFTENLALFIQGWMFEGGWRDYTSFELLYGWKSSIAAKANGGDYWQGADFSVQEWMTPIFNDNNGTVAGAPYGLYSGSFSIDNVSGIRLLNGEAYLNKLTPTWNGTYYTNVTQ